MERKEGHSRPFPRENKAAPRYSKTVSPVMKSVKAVPRIKLPTRASLPSE